MGENGKEGLGEVRFVEWLSEDWIMLFVEIDSGLKATRLSRILFLPLFKSGMLSIFLSLSLLLSRSQSPASTSSAHSAAAAKASARLRSTSITLGSERTMLVTIPTASDLLGTGWVFEDDLLFKSFTTPRCI